jgi:uncharacterized protein (DUF849 family)
MAKTIVTAAITGAIHTPSMSPYLPLTGNQIIEEILAVHEAGGAIAHVHVRNEQSGLPNADQDVYRRIGEKVKRHCDIIICFTTGGRLGEPVENRVRVVSNLRPEMASLNAGSLNFALFHVADRVNQWQQPWEKDYLEATEDFIFPNTFRTMREFLAIFRSHNTKPEFEIYDVGMINNLAYLIKAGHTDEPVHLQFVMGILGGIPATPDNLIFLLNTAQKALGRFTWSVCAAGRAQFSMCTQALLLGGHVRVGLEDNLYLDKGIMAKSNAEQVSKIIRIMRELGEEPASPEEARAILGLKGVDTVNY